MTVSFSRMPLLTATQARALDAETLARDPELGFDLMCTAGIAIAHKVSAILGEDPNAMVLVLAGPGNNGGDGVVAAMELLTTGRRVELLLFADPASLRGDAARALALYVAHGFSFTTCQDTEPCLVTLAALREPTASVVDALLGSGGRGALRGSMRVVVEEIARWNTPVLAVDVPSGYQGVLDEAEGPVLRAHWTLVPGHYRPECFFPPAPAWFGTVSLIELKYPQDLVSRHHGGCRWMVDETAWKSMLPKRIPWGGKHEHGIALLACGSRGMTGAAVLATQAALRSGTGMVRLAFPQSEGAVLASHLIESVLHPLACTATGTLCEAAILPFLDLMQRAQAVLLGPGLSVQSDAMTFVRQVLGQITVPLVLDADGLNAFRGNADALKDHSGSLVLTPHAGEWQRLFGPVPDSMEARLDRVAEVGRQYGVVVVLKGAPTLVGTPDGEVYLIPTANSGMAKGGSGDVLAGLITGLLAQGCPPIDAALLGVRLHSLAGFCAVTTQTEWSMLPSDVILNLPEAFRRLSQSGNPC